MKNKPYSSDSVRMLRKLKEQDDADEREEREEIARMVARTDLICPFCEENSTKASKRTGELLPCKKCYNKRIQLCRYNLTLKEFYALKKKQQGLCRICNKEMKVAYVDHCHLLGHCRGLLCPSCNTGLGLFQDDEDLLRRAAKYIEDNRFSRV